MLVIGNTLQEILYYAINFSHHITFKYFDYMYDYLCNVCGSVNSQIYTVPRNVLKEVVHYLGRN